MEVIGAFVPGKRRSIIDGENIPAVNAIVEKCTRAGYIPNQYRTPSVTFPRGRVSGAKSMRRGARRDIRDDGHDIHSIPSRDALES